MFYPYDFIIQMWRFFGVEQEKAPTCVKYVAKVAQVTRNIDKLLEFEMEDASDWKSIQSGVNDTTKHANKEDLCQQLLPNMIGINRAVVSQLRIENAKRFTSV